MTARHILSGRAEALAEDPTTFDDSGFVLDDDVSFDGDQLDREERAALRRVSGLSTELEDVTEVEYRQLRLERVVLAAVWSEGTADRRRELACASSPRSPRRPAPRCSPGVVQRRSNPDPATYLGKGKAAELRDIVIAEGADTVVCDTELAPSQRRALEDVVKVKVIDRTALILDIFAQHAKSREGKAQVELAQLQYLLPRLRGWGESMSRQAGGQAAGGQGMGSRGPGETKIELDRRRINTRIAKLRREIKEMKTVRDTKRGQPQGERRAERRDRRLHQRGQVEHPQPPHQRGRARREPALRDPRPHRAPRRDARRPGLHARRHRRVRPPAAAPARRGVPLHARGGRRGRPAPPRRRRLPRRPRGPDLRGACRPRRRRCHRRQGGHRHQQGRPRRPRGHRPAPSPREALDRRLRPHRCRARRAAHPHRRRAAPARRRGRRARALRPRRPREPHPRAGRGAGVPPRGRGHPGAGPGARRPRRRAGAFGAFGA